MNTSRWDATNEYLLRLFGRLPSDDPLFLLSDAARQAKFPDISVGPVVGRLLLILSSMTRGPKRLALEIGTLAGYSAVWIARGLGSQGRLITIEIEPRYADFAAKWFDRAGLANRIDLRRGAALDILPDIAKEIGEGGLHFLFLDAEKTEYPDYWRLTRPLIAPGGLVVIDNALGSGSWWIDDVGHPAREAAQTVNQMIAEDPDFEAVGIPLRQGLLLARRME